MLDRILIEHQCLRYEAAREVHQVMAHFPKTIQLMHDIQSNAHPDDHSFAENCELALACMLESLERLPPAPSGKISHFEQTIHEWLGADQTHAALDADTLHRFHKAAENIFMKNWTPFG